MGLLSGAPYNSSSQLQRIRDCSPPVWTHRPVMLREIRYTLRWWGRCTESTFSLSVHPKQSRTRDQPVANSLRGNHQQLHVWVNHLECAFNNCWISGEGNQGRINARLLIRSDWYKSKYRFWSGAQVTAHVRRTKRTIISSWKTSYSGNVRLYVRKQLHSRHHRSPLHMWLKTSSCPANRSMKPQHQSCTTETAQLQTG